MECPGKTRNGGIYLGYLPALSTENLENSGTFFVRSIDNPYVFAYREPIKGVLRRETASTGGVVAYESRTCRKSEYEQSFGGR